MQIMKQIEAATPGNCTQLTRGVLHLQDNAPAHTLQVAMTVATKCGFEILPHTSYSPDMAPSDFYQFPKLKSFLRGTQYGSNEGLIETVNEYLLYVCLLF